MARPHYCDVEQPPPWQTDRLQIAVIAHPRRHRQANQLAIKVGADLIWDTHSHGCEANHRQAWRWLVSSGADWMVFLEDDAAVVPGFREQLSKALDAAPTKLVSLYLGRGRPPHWQLPIADAITTLPDADTCWLVGPELLSAVGYAVRADLLKHLACSMARNAIPIEQFITRIAGYRKSRVSYTWPSLVEHRDQEPLITQRADGAPRTEPRVAWKTGTRATWNATTHRIKTPEQLGITVIKESA